MIHAHGESDGPANGVTRLSLDFEKVFDEGLFRFLRLLALLTSLTIITMQRRPQVVVHLGSAGGIVCSGAYDTSSLYECALADGHQVLRIIVLVTRIKRQI